MQTTVLSSDCPFDANGQQMGAGVLSRVIFYIFSVLLGLQLISTALQMKLFQDGIGMMFVVVGCIFTFFALWAWYYHLQKCRPWTGFGMYIVVTMLSYIVMIFLLVTLVLKRLSDPPNKKEKDVVAEGLKNGLHEK